MNKLLTACHALFTDSFLGKCLFKGTTIKGTTLTILITSVLISGCQDNTSVVDNAVTVDNTSLENTNLPTDDKQSASQKKTSAAGFSQTNQQPNEPMSKQSKKVVIDWTKIDSGIDKVDPNTFNYPFAIDSAPVKAYMDYFKVDARTAQYNLTVGMASNEALSKVLDQLEHYYASHQITDGDDIKLVIHTTGEVAPSQYDYVIADDFAKGLTLPIYVIADGKKGESPQHLANSLNGH